jgi:hypothetical protein
VDFYDVFFGFASAFLLKDSILNSNRIDNYYDSPAGVPRSQWILYLPLLEILATVNRYSHWMDELQHWQQRHHGGRPSEQTVYAGVIGIGCTIGIRKMARISHPISESALEHTVNWYFSLDNIIAANDRLLPFMNRRT